MYLLIVVLMLCSVIMCRFGWCLVLLSGNRLLFMLCRIVL